MDDENWEESQIFKMKIKILLEVVHSREEI